MRSQFILILIGFLLVAASCKKDNNNKLPQPEESTFQLIKTHESNLHQILVYSLNAEFSVGYNEIFIQVKDKYTGSLLSPEVMECVPLMHMTSKVHSCPHSAMQEGDNGLYNGFVIFQMAGNSSEYWELQLQYSIEGAAYNENLRIEVDQERPNHRSVAVFKGSDDKKYVLCLLPFKPRVAINDVSAMLYEMEDMIRFNPVTDYIIGLDPRMPGMGNHSSPNNVDFSFHTSELRYEGQLSLTMTGYWVLNLMLYDGQGSLIKGEEIQAGTTQSTLYMELEF